MPDGSIWEVEGATETGEHLTQAATERLGGSLSGGTERSSTAAKEGAVVTPDPADDALRPPRIIKTPEQVSPLMAELKVYGHFSPRGTKCKLCGKVHTQ